MSKKIILRQSVKSGVAVVFFFGLGMASINAQTTQTTQPTGKVGINTTEPTETLDVKGKVRIQGLYSENDQTGTNNNANFNATNVVTADDNGVLGKKSLSSIIAAQTPNFPWKKVGTTENAVPAEGLKIYSKYAVGIGDYSATNSSVGSSFEINGGNSSQLGLINGSTKWDISTENKALTFTKRKPDNGRIFSVTQDAKLFLGNNLLSEGGSNAKVILDGGNGKIGIGKNSAEYNLDVEGDAKISGLKTTSDNITNGSTTSKYSPAKMVVVDENGVLGKQDFPTIPTMPTIPTEPWQVAGSSTQATANNQKIYQNNNVGIGDYSSTDIGSRFEINGGNSSQLGLINGSTKWDISTEDKALTFTKRKPENGRIFSVTQDAKLYLGHNLLSEGGSNAKVILDGGNGKIGINQNSANYNLDVAGDAKISGLKSGNGYTASHMVVADANGVLGKVDIPTIPTEPWRQLGGTTQATANTDNIYQKGKVGIGDYTSTSTFDSDFEVSSTRSGYQIGIANGDSKWNLSTESGEERAFSITKRHPNNQGRILSLDKDAKLYLGNTLLNNSGNGAKILVDGGQGKVAIGKNSANYTLDVNGNTGIKGRLNLIDADSDNNDFLLYSKGTQLLFDKKIAVPALGASATQTGVMASLTNVGKLYLGESLTKPSGQTLYTGNAKILLDGQEGKVAIGHNNPAEALDVNGKAKIQTIEKQTATTGLDMVVVGADGILKKADIPTGGGSGNGVTKHTGNSTPLCNAANAGTIHYKEGVTVNGNTKSTSVMGFCMKTANGKYRWFYIFGGAGTTAGSEAEAPNFGDDIR